MSLKHRLVEEGGFLGRWSKLKREQSQPEETSVEEPEIQKNKALEPLPEPIEEPAEIEPLPDIETLRDGSDFKPFMNPTVSPDIRAQALRKLWASNPLYNHIDMLDDYCEDYTDKAVVIPGMKTAYKVGRGFLDKFEKVTEELEQPLEHIAEAKTADKELDHQGDKDQLENLAMEEDAKNTESVVSLKPDEQNS